MRLVVLADTHIPDRSENIPASLVKELKKADLVIHAGDFTSLDAFKKIKSINSLKAVLGNLDAPELREFLREKETLMLQKYKIGIMHGFGQAENVLDNIKKQFDDTFDLVIFGHTHNAFVQRIGRTLFFNPGSPTDKIFAAYNSYGIIELNDTIETNIIKL